MRIGAVGEEVSDQMMTSKIIRMVELMEVNEEKGADVAMPIAIDSRTTSSKCNKYRGTSLMNWSILMKTSPHSSTLALASQIMWMKMKIITIVYIIEFNF